MSLQKNLLSWFEKNARPLPWRRHYKPYEVWISEIMLQQTQMDTVIPYFLRWMAELPSIRALAAAPEQKVLKLWEGLGYYSRARNLHHSAKTICEKFGGEFPEDYDTILSLKGIGRYTGGAIASIAFNQDKPIVDGNVIRVLSRTQAVAEHVDSPETKQKFWELQEKLIPAGKARFFNQALMELGALVCTPSNPACPACPIRNFCRAYSRGNPEAYPVRSARKKTVRVEAAALALRRKGKYLLVLRPAGKIMGGLWEFPEWKLAREDKLEIKKKSSRARALAKKELGTNGIRLEHAGRIKRNYTHHLETLDVFLAESASAVAPRNGWRHAWASPDEFRLYPFSSAHAKIARLLKG